MKNFAFNMSRRPPSDTFTRFTSTTPHATTFTYQPASQPNIRSTPSSEPPPAPSSSSPSQRAPKGETALEKVARLRAAHRAAVESEKYSTIDRIIVAGRNIADRAHRFTVYGLIFAAGVSFCVTAYGATSLITHTRKMHRIWIDGQLDKLDQARSAFLRGEATAEQLHILEQERAGDEMQAARMREAARKKEEGIWGRFTKMVGGTLAKGDAGEETAQEREKRLARKSRRENDESWIEGEIQPVSAPPGSVVKDAVRVASTGIPGVGVDSKGRPVPAGRVEYITRKIEEEPTTGEKISTVRAGGPLDLMASNVAGAVAGSSTSHNQGWMSWIRGGSRTKPSE